MKLSEIERLLQTFERDLVAKQATLAKTTRAEDALRHDIFGLRRDQAQLSHVSYHGGEATGAHLVSARKAWIFAQIESKNMALARTLAAKEAEKAQIRQAQQRVLAMTMARDALRAATRDRQRKSADARLLALMLHPKKTDGA